MPISSLFPQNLGNFAQLLNESAQQDPEQASQILQQAVDQATGNPTNPIVDAIQRMSQFHPQSRFSDLLYNQLLNAPQRTPESQITPGRRIMAGLAGLNTKPAGVVGGQPVGLERVNPLQEQILQEQMLQSPFYHAMEDWQARLKPVESGAQSERIENANNIRLLNDIALRNLNVQKQNTAEQAMRNLDVYHMAGRALQARRLTMQEYLAQNPDGQIVYGADGSAFGVNRRTNIATPITVAQPAQQPTNQQGTTPPNQPPNPTPNGTPSQTPPTIPDTSQPTTAPTTPIATPPALTKQPTNAPGTQLKGSGPMQLLQQRQLNEMAAAVSKNANAKEMEDIKARHAKELEELRQTGRETLADKRAEAKTDQITPATRARMENAGILKRSLPKLLNSGKVLAENNQFGPITSKIRNYFNNTLGTVGSPDDIESAVAKFNAALKSDPTINSARESGDFEVANFTTLLSYMISGMALIHGRSGASMPMIKQMQEAMNASGSFNNWMGRMAAFDTILSSIAAGPQKLPGEKERTKDAMQTILDRMYPPKK